MAEKGIRDRISQTIHLYVKANNKHLKWYHKNRETSYHEYWDVSNLYGCAISQKLSIDGLKWVENISQFNKDYRENYNPDNNEG